MVLSWLSAGNMLSAHHKNFIAIALFDFRLHGSIRVGRVAEIRFLERLLSESADCVNFDPETNDFC
jgi:hypothetical protein